MEKIKKHLTKYEKIYALIFIAIAVSAFSFNIYIEPNDESWNFSNIYKMSKGEMIYRDCNVIITPIFFYIGNILFKIFGANFFVFRIYNAIINIGMYYLIYMILRRLKISTTKSITYMLIFYMLFSVLIQVGANYNLLAVMFVILGILNNLKEKKKPIFQGIIAFLVFMSKQNIGVLYIAGLFICGIILEKDRKKLIKEYLVEAITFLALLLIFITYLNLTGNLYNFLNYTILGLKEFGTYNLMYESDIYIWAFEIFICIFVLYYSIINRRKIDENEYKNTINLWGFAAFMLIIAYPIFNKAHIMIASIIFALASIYFIENKIINKKISENNKVERILKTVNVIGLISIVIWFSISTGDYINKINENSYEVYYGGVIKKELQEEIEEVTRYIKEQEDNGIDVKVISYRANLYMNVLKKNNGEMDLPFIGNLGIDGEDGLIEKIARLKNTKILISKEELQYQESEAVRKYIMENLNRVGEINQFWIYESDN